MYFVSMIIMFRMLSTLREYSNQSLEESAEGDQRTAEVGESSFIFSISFVV